MALAVASTLVVGGGTTVFADTSSSGSGQQMVWVAKDVTQQDGYQLIYKTYDTNGNVVSTQTVVPPAGSLVEFFQEPLSQAVAEGSDYILATAGTPLTHQQSHELHQELFNKLNPKLTQSSTMQPAVTPQSSTATPESVTGQYHTDTPSGTLIGYTAYYTNEGNGYLSLTQFQTWKVQGTATEYQSWIGLGPSDTTTWTYNWPNPNPQIPRESPYIPPISWTGSQGDPLGYTFTTDCSNNAYPWLGTNYEGWATLS